MKTSELNTFLFDFRVEIMAVLLTTVVFGGGIAPSRIFDDFVFPMIILLLSIVAIITARNQKKFIQFIFSGFGFLAITAMIIRLLDQQLEEVRAISLIFFILFLSILSYEVFRQMLKEKEITLSIIFAAFDCYLLLGVLGAMLFTLMVMVNPDSFTNVQEDMHVFDKMNYFSFITLTSIGYGDITPATVVAEKVTAFYGLIGHFYSVVFVGIIVGIYVGSRS